MAGCARGGQRVARPVLGMGLTWAPRPDSGTQRQATGPDRGRPSRARIDITEA